MPVKPKTTASKPQPEKSEKKEQKQNLSTVIHLSEWDVESRGLQYSHAGNAYAQFKLSGENNFTYYATAFGELAEQLDNGEYKGDSLIIEVGYDKDREGKIVGYKLFLRAMPF